MLHNIEKILLLKRFKCRADVASLLRVLDGPRPCTYGHTVGLQFENVMLTCFRDRLVPMVSIQRAA